MTDLPAELEMEVKGLMIDPNQKVPIVVLRDREETMLLPIWIGPCEANAIALELQGKTPARPMTHDLLLSTIAELGAVVRRILISDLADDTFFARIHLRQEGAAAPDLVIDSRPSDAIALAIRAEAPIFVHKKVLDTAKAAEILGEKTEEEKLKEWLESVSPEDLGKYEM